MTTWQTRLVQPTSHAPPGFRPLATPTWRGSTTLFPDAAALRDSWDHEEAAYTYGLYGTPTTLELAGRVAELERGYRTLLTPGGQSGLALIYLAFLSAGDHVLVPESVYGPSREFADGVLKRFGVDITYYPPTIGRGIASLVRQSTRLVWCESPGSITFEVQDVPAIAEVAQSAGAVVAIDNTWSAGVHFDAFAHGAHVSMQALTKYAGGHSDVLVGSVTACDQGVFEQLGETHAELGLAVSPDDCSLVLRGLQTLAVRLAEIERSALDVADWLSTRAEVETVLHPAFPSCPGHELWRRDFTGSTGTFSVVFARHYTKEQIFRFIDSLKLFRIGYSWGGTTSLVIPGQRETTRPDYQYGHRLVRLSLGLESVGDLVGDLKDGLEVLEA